MDVEEIIVLFIAIFTALCFTFVESTEIFLVLLLIFFAATLEIAGVLIPKSSKEILKSLIYLLLIFFIGIVVKRALEVLR